MCDCKNPIPNSPAVVQVPPCEAISVNVLKTYIKPLYCYRDYSLLVPGIEQQEVLLSIDYLEQLINQKAANPLDCSNMERFPIVRGLLERVMQNGHCL